MGFGFEVIENVLLVEDDCSTSSVTDVVLHRTRNEAGRHVLLLVVVAKHQRRVLTVIARSVQELETKLVGGDLNITRTIARSGGISREIDVLV